MITFDKKILWITFFISSFAIGNDSVFNIMDNPTTAKKNLEISISGGYQIQTGNSKNSNLTAKTALTLYSSNLAYSFFGNAVNNSSNNQRLSETYQVGVRTRYNLTKFDYLFTQTFWLKDRYNSFNFKEVFTIGYGRQIFNDFFHSLKVEAGQSIRYEYFTNTRNKITKLGYISSNYEWKITNSVKFKQGVSFFTKFNNDSYAISEATLQISINKCLLLNLIYNINWNHNPPLLPQKQIDTNTFIQLGYVF